MILFRPLCSLQLRATQFLAGSQAEVNRILPAHGSPRRRQGLHGVAVVQPLARLREAVVGQPPDPHRPGRDDERAGFRRRRNAPIAPQSSRSRMFQASLCMLIAKAAIRSSRGLPDTVMFGALYVHGSSSFLRG